ncbi:hypothetical protein [Photobacterium damselae]|uniref:hypothetical protein n=1 Tax=Photobacterium damselae TaxID=38293 RepID=UPI001F2B444C|nr:hypothetical protein [Photobacterium damselae]UKA04811.1 hypothetical protein IHC89_21450 [Photobacterium damselae subsp. damselae]
MTNINKAVLREKIQKQFDDFVELVFSENGKLDKLLRSGAIDLSEKEDGFKTSSKVMMALGSEMTRQYDNCMSKSDHKDVKNIALFL